MKNLTAANLTVVPPTLLNGEFPIIDSFIGVTPNVVTKKVYGSYVAVKFMDTIIHNQKVYLAWNLPTESYIKNDGVTILRIPAHECDIDATYSVFHSIFKQQSKIRWTRVRNLQFKGDGYSTVTTLALLSDLEYLSVAEGLGEVAKLKKAHGLILLAQQQVETLTQLESSISFHSTGISV